MTDDDHGRLSGLIRSRGDLTVPGKEHLLALRERLAGARVVASHEIPAGVVTMNSRFRLRNLETGDENEYTLVFAGGRDGRISVVAPVGSLLIGVRERDTIEVASTAGPKRFRIEAVTYQPEAAELEA